MEGASGSGVEGGGEAVVESRTVHVEGLSEYTREEQIAALFSL
jgi:hypothetical protein